MVRRVVPALERDSSLLRLRVVEPHLELDRRPPPGTTQDRIPRPLLDPALQRRQRDLPPMDQRLASTGQQPLQLLGMPAVAERCPARVQPQERIETQHDRDPEDLDDAQRRHVAELDPAVAAAVHARGLGDGPLAESEGEPRAPELAPEAPGRLETESHASVHLPLDRSHRQMVASGASPALISSFTPALFCQRTTATGFVRGPAPWGAKVVELCCGRTTATRNGRRGRSRGR